MLIELRPIESIRPYDKNPRHNDGAVDAVAKSLKEYGFRQPIVVDESGTIVVGHTRWKAARQLGLTEVPVHVATDLTPEQARAYRIADNRLAAIATFDFELLPVELAELKAMNVDLGLLGFEPKEIERLLNATVNHGLTDPDDIPAPPDEPVTRRGDKWRLGKNWLLCGDSANPADVDRLVDGQPIHLIVCDPPYNVKVEPRSNNAIAAGLSSFEATHHQKFDSERRDGDVKATHKQLRARDRPLANDFVSEEEFTKLLDAWFGNMARVLLPGRALYCWGGYGNFAAYPPALARAGFYFSQGIIWDKQHPVLTRKDFMGAYEVCYYSWKEGAAHQFFGPANIPDLWAVKKIPPQLMTHLTSKPVELSARPIEYSSRPGECVADFFGGSGPTLIAAEQLGRRAYIMEMDELYADQIRLRWEQFTGQKAELVSRADGAASPEKTPTEAGVEAGE